MQWFAFETLKYQSEFAKFCTRSIAACLIASNFSWTANRRQSNLTLSSVTGCFMGPFPLPIQPTPLNNLHHFWMDICIGDSLPISVRNICRTVTRDCNTWHVIIHLAFCSWDSSFHSCGVSATDGKNWKLANFENWAYTHPIKFICPSIASYFLRNSEFKFSTFHVFSLHFQFGSTSSLCKVGVGHYEYKLNFTKGPPSKNKTEVH
jgi:hypothetical protein